ncbi:M15 family metallopeptidase [Testudinibacter sp. P80/BLE/0925]|uniref:M15 family metallopeptidase n=1 Tax=Testudinibacter sp. TW-1 TaxID=3417757 RepID=UPI003D364CE4
MTNFKFGTTSEIRLQGVHPDLVKVVRLALKKSPVDFAVIEGKRSIQRQKQLFTAGNSKTMRSRHLTGHAVDLVPLPVDWNNKQAFNDLAAVMFEAAKELGVSIRWGGDWNENGRSDDERFYDGPHFELTWRAYP